MIKKVITVTEKEVNEQLLCQIKKLIKVGKERHCVALIEFFTRKLLASIKLNLKEARKETKMWRQIINDEKTNFNWLKFIATKQIELLMEKVEDEKIENWCCDCKLKN